MKAQIQTKSMKAPVNANITKDSKRAGMLKATYCKRTETNISMVTLVGEKYQEMFRAAIAQ